MSSGSSEQGPRRRRDGAETRERVLSAALDEFTAKGYAGARVEAMAARAGVNVRALYQHFGSKEALYEAVFGDSFRKKHNAVLDAIEAVVDDEGQADELLGAFHQSLAGSLAFVRLVTWDALSVSMDRPGTDVMASAVRADMYVREIELIRQAQRAGHIPPTLDADLLLVALMALAIFPSALRPLTQVITGQSPESAAFRKRYDAFLAELGRSILAKRTDAGRVETPDAERDLHRTLRTAARALSSAGLVTAYGHCSIRRDESTFLVTPVVPLGHITRQPGILVPVEGELPDDVPGEVRMHQAIYRRRADVGGIARVLPTAVRALSVLGLTARPLDGTGSYFAPGPPLWSDPGLVRTAEAADGVADTLGDAPAIVLRGNGAVIVGNSLPRAVVLAQFLETASEIDLAVRSTGSEAIEFSAAEIAARAVWAGKIEERMWSHLTRDDPEAGGPSGQ